MSILFILVPAALVLALLAAFAFAWSARTGQLDDLETPAFRMLHDDEPDGLEPRRSELEHPTETPLK